MPHYKDGTPAKCGDLIVRVNDYDNSQTLAIVTSINENASSCNATAIHVAAKQGDNPWFPSSSFGPGPQYTFTLSECSKVDAVKVADPPPPPPPEPVDS